jgi:hypothetical protein
VDVQPADGLAPGRDAGVLDELPVARVRGDVLHLREAERMRAGGCDAQAARPRGLVCSSAQLLQGGLGLARRRADAGRELEHRRQQLHLERARQLAALGRREQRLDPRRQRERVRVEDQHLFLDAERPGGALAEMLLDQGPYASRAAATACASSYGFQEPRKKRAT